MVPYSLEKRESGSRLRRASAREIFTLDPMERIVVVGNSGSGKTTLARNLADELGLAHIELDSLFHQPGWTPQDPEVFRADLRERMLACPTGWTICGNYASLSWDITMPRADTIVWLDLPRHVVMRRVAMRTLRRALFREELWNGNLEPLGNFYKWDPEQNIIRWAWVKHHEYRRRYLQAMVDGTWAHAEVHQLTSVGAASRFLADAA